MLLLLLLLSRGRSVVKVTADARIRIDDKTSILLGPEGVTVVVDGRGRRFAVVSSAESRRSVGGTSSGRRRGETSRGKCSETRVDYHMRSGRIWVSRTTSTFETDFARARPAVVDVITVVVRARTAAGLRPRKAGLFILWQNVTIIIAIFLWFFAKIRHRRGSFVSAHSVDIFINRPTASLTS